MNKLTSIPVHNLLKILSLPKSTFYDWVKRDGVPNQHNGIIPKRHWSLPWERKAVISYAKRNPGEGYRRLSYQMIDNNIVALTPSSVYRILKKEGLLNKWNKTRTKPKGNGFDQPLAPHRDWHIDIKYVNFRGTFLYLICIIDGYSRFIVHHELRSNMTEFDVQLTIQRALEKYPEQKPRIISDNGTQFICRDFTEFIRFVGLNHIRTSVAHPQSNGKIERFNRSISEECLRVNSFINISDAENQISQYITYYNTERLHSAIYYLTPVEILQGKKDQRLAERDHKLAEALRVRHNTLRASVA